MEEFFCVRYLTCPQMEEYCGQITKLLCVEESPTKRKKPTNIDVSMFVGFFK